MAAFKGPHNVNPQRAWERAPWERTPWWHWRKVILRQAWRRHAPEQWRHADASYLIYQTAKQRARQVLSERCDPDRIIISHAGYEAAKLKFSDYRGSQQ